MGRSWVQSLTELHVNNSIQCPTKKTKVILHLHTSMAIHFLSARLTVTIFFSFLHVSLKKIKFNMSDHAKTFFNCYPFLVYSADWLLIHSHSQDKLAMIVLWIIYSTHIFYKKLIRNSTFRLLRKLFLNKPSILI